MAELVGLAIPSKLKFTSKLLTQKNQGLTKNPPELPGPFCFRDTSFGRGVEAYSRANVPCLYTRLGRLRETAFLMQAL